MFNQIEILKVQTGLAKKNDALDDIHCMSEKSFYATLDSVHIIQNVNIYSCL